MARFQIIIYDIRPSGHKLNVYKATFGCANSTNHKKDILKFLVQLETDCKPCMKFPPRHKRPLDTGFSLAAFIQSFWGEH